MDMSYRKSRYGSIREVSSTSFVWHVPQLIGMIEGGKYYEIGSPVLHFDSQRWRIVMNKHHTRSCDVSRITLLCVDYSVMRTLTYRLRMTGIHGERYMLFPALKDTFKHIYDSGTPQDHPESDLLKDVGRNDPDGDLSVHLDFYPGEGEILPGEGVRAESGPHCTADCGTQTSHRRVHRETHSIQSILPAESRPSTADCGTQTYRPNPRFNFRPRARRRVSSNSDGVRAESRPHCTADCGTQTSHRRVHRANHSIQSILPAESRPSTADCGTQTYRPNPRFNFRPRSRRAVLSDSDDIENLVQDLKDILQSGQKSDITLVVNGREFKAHQNILVARSRVFSAMLNEEWLEQASGAVQITDCDAEVFQDFLRYLYSGKVETLEVKNVVELFTIADKYDVKSLAKHCVDFMIRNLTVDSFCDFVPLALRHCEVELMESANRFLAENVKQIICTEKWKVFNSQNPNAASELLVKAL